MTKNFTSGEIAKSEEKAQEFEDLLTSLGPTLLLITTSFCPETRGYLPDFFTLAQILTKDERYLGTRYNIVKYSIDLAVNEIKTDRIIRRFGLVGVQTPITLFLNHKERELTEKEAKEINEKSLEEYKLKKEGEKEGKSFEEEKPRKKGDFPVNNRFWLFTSEKNVEPMVKYSLRLPLDDSKMYPKFDYPPIYYALTDFAFDIFNSFKASLDEDEDFKNMFLYTSAGIIGIFLAVCIVAAFSGGEEEKKEPTNKTGKSSSKDKQE